MCVPFPQYGAGVLAPAAERREAKCLGWYRTTNKPASAVAINKPVGGSGNVFSTSGLVRKTPDSEENEKHARMEGIHLPVFGCFAQVRVEANRLQSGTWQLKRNTDTDGLVESSDARDAAGKNMACVRRIPGLSRQR